MVTTIQVDEKVLQLLKKWRTEMQASSYNEAIQKVEIERRKKKFKSMAGSLRKYYKTDEDLKKLLKEMQEERRNSDRF